MEAITASDAPTSSTFLGIVKAVRTVQLFIQVLGLHPNQLQFDAAAPDENGATKTCAIRSANDGS